jgi:hypothetical protein
MIEAGMMTYRLKLPAHRIALDHDKLPVPVDIPRSSAICSPRRRPVPQREQHPREPARKVQSGHRDEVAASTRVNG